MLLRGLGDDFTGDVSLTDPFAGASLSTDTWAASTGSSLGPAITDTSSIIAGPGNAPSIPISSGGSGLNFTDIANAIVKVIPSLVTGAVVYNKATKPATTVSPSIPNSYNPVYSGYYGSSGLPAVPGYPGLTGQAAPDNTMLYVALGIAGLFVLKGLRG